MTLVLAITTQNSIWMLADRRLSWKGRQPSDTACKIMRLETFDGVSLLGYAGLGMTARGNEPSTWMANALTGRNVSIVDSLKILANASDRQLPSHLSSLPPGLRSHTIIAPCIVDNRQKIFTIDHNCPPTKSRNHNFVATGSGAKYLQSHQAKVSIRNLHSIVKKFDEMKTTAYSVADEFAKINMYVHKEDEKFVGPKCLVVWSLSKRGVHQGGGGYQYYNELERDGSDNPTIPTIAQGMNVGEFITRLLPNFTARSQQNLASGFDVDIPEIDLSDMPTTPDERLR